MIKVKIKNLKKQMKNQPLIYKKYKNINTKFKLNYLKKFNF